MNTKVASLQLFSKVQRLLLVGLAVIVLFGSLPVGKARAWAYGGSLGRPGTVKSIPTIYVGEYTTYIYSNGSVLPVVSLNLVSNTGPVVLRSPAAAGAQNVMAVYTVQSWNGSGWSDTGQPSVYIGQIGATQSSYTFPAAYIRPAISTGYKRVTWQFAWFSTTGTQLGATLVEPTLATEHACLIPRCQSALGYFGTW